MSYPFSRPVVVFLSLSHLAALGGVVLSRRFFLTLTAKSGGIAVVANYLVIYFSRRRRLLSVVKKEKENVAAFGSALRHLPTVQRRQPSVVHQTAGIVFVSSTLELLTFSFSRWPRVLSGAFCLIQ